MTVSKKSSSVSLINHYTTKSWDWGAKIYVKSKLSLSESIYPSFISDTGLGDNLGSPAHWASDMGSRHWKLFILTLPTIDK